MNNGTCTLISSWVFDSFFTRQQVGLILGVVFSVSVRPEQCALMKSFQGNSCSIPGGSFCSPAYTAEAYRYTGIRSVRLILHVYSIIKIQKGGCGHFYTDICIRKILILYKDINQRFSFYEKYSCLSIKYMVFLRYISK